MIQDRGIRSARDGGFSLAPIRQRDCGETKKRRFGGLFTHTFVDFDRLRHLLVIVMPHNPASKDTMQGAREHIQIL